MEQLLADCCMEFLKFITNLKDAGKITNEEYQEMAKTKIEFLSRVTLLH